MSYEPRSRGMRSRRPSTKKLASKAKRMSENQEFAYKEPVSINPQEVASRATNALEHLGTQRFGMPPYSEHFRRWLVDIESVLNEVKTALPETAGEVYTNSVAQLLSAVRTELNNRIGAEDTLSAKVTDLQARLADIERQMMELENEQRSKVHEVKRDSSKSVRRLQGEIDALDAQRLRLLRQETTFLERLFGSRKVRVEEGSRSLNSKRTDLENRTANLQERVGSIRVSYQQRRKPLVDAETTLRRELAELRANSLDDAVEIRKTACDTLRKLISAVVSDPTSQGQEGTDST